MFVCQEYIVPEGDQIYVLPGDVLGMHFDDSGNHSFVYHDYVGISTPMYNCKPCESMHKCVCVCVSVCVSGWMYNCEPCESMHKCVCVVCVSVCQGGCTTVNPARAYVSVCVCVSVCVSGWMYNCEPCESMRKRGRF